MRSGGNAAACRRRPWPSAPSRQLALELLAELVADGSLPARWVSCDEGYGRSVDFLDGVAALGLGTWRRCRSGRNGRRPSCPACGCGWHPNCPRRPGRAAAGRGTVAGPDTVRVFLCHAPRRITPARLAHLTDAHWAIETCFREGRQLLGLGDYEGRSWQGWHRHMTLCMPPALLPAAGWPSKKQPGWRGSWTSCRAAPPAMRPRSVPTLGDAGRNSHPDFSLQ